MAVSGLLGVVVLTTALNIGSIGKIFPILDERIAESPARPELLGPLDGAAAVVTPQAWWSERAPALLAQLEANVYGRLPPPAPVEVVSKRRLQPERFKPQGRVEEWTLRTTAGALPIELHAIAVLPPGEGPFPVIIGETFCSNRNAFHNDPQMHGGGPADGDCGGGGLQQVLVKAIFGKHIITPPFEKLLKRGYALVLLHPGEVTPDRADLAIPRLEAIAPALASSPQRPGAIGLWAWTFGRLLDAVEADGRFDHAREVLWGHSRYGKAALLGAALDPRADAVVALQSGTGGATLSRSFHGESVGEITAAYPHWFAPAFAAFAGKEDELPIDQHALLSLIAPRPVLLGSARQDRWSDPKGAFRAAQGADPVYALLGRQGLEQPRMSAFNRNADIGYFLRSGLHGVTTTDWKRTLQFLDAQFARPDRPQPPPAHPPTAEPLQATPVER